MTTPDEPEPSDTENRPSRRTRRLRQVRIPEPTQHELDTLSVKERIELIGQRRQSLHQTLNSVGILFGVVFTAASLIATALTLRTAQESQITDRYTKAVEQLGSDEPEVRMGGIYALERLMVDSGRDRRTIIEVLAAYASTHAQDRPLKGVDKTRLAIDAQAALTVIARTHLADADLRDIDLHGKDLSDWNLRGANLTSANLVGANLTSANLVGANLNGANLSAATLKSADLTGAKMVSTYLRATDLSKANLNGAKLNFADLNGAALSGANLTGAHLSGIVGLSPYEIRKIAKTDATTRFE